MKGFVPHADVAALYSSGRQWSFCLISKQAKATSQQPLSPSDKPVIATNVGSLSEMVADGRTGIDYSPDGHGQP